MHIALTYNLKPEGAAGDRFEEFDSIETIEALERGIRAAGHEPVRLGWGEELLDGLEREQVDGVFNIAEGVGGRGRESQVPALLEMLGIPFSGSDALAIGMTLDKSLAKLVAKAHGIATAPWVVLREWRTPELRYPLFAKPACEGSSMGITSRSLCRTPDALHEAFTRLRAYGPVLVEEFLPEDEFTVGIVDGDVLGAMQVVPRQRSDDFIYSLDVKRDYASLVNYRLVSAPDVEELALAVWRALGLRNVARVDVRRDRDGVACFVEVNPLPGVHPVNSDLVILARLKGISHEELIGRILRSAGFQAAGPAASRCRRALAAHGSTPSRHDGGWKPPGQPAGSRRSNAGRSALSVAVCFNDDAHLKSHLNPTELLGEQEVAAAAGEIASALNATLVPVRDDILGALRQLQQFDVVVNLCEGVLGQPRLEKNFALALEMLGVRHTSGDPISIAICGDKALTKALLRAGGLPSPAGFPVTTDTSERDLVQQLSALHLPTIVKPSQEDAGVGIEPASVSRTVDEVIERCRHIHQTYQQPALVEEFIDGEELNQALYHGPNGLVMLPPGEVCFAPELAPGERIVGWKAKWDEGSPEDLGTVNRTPAQISESLRAEIARLCTDAVQLLGITGYCRFDLRRSLAGELFIVDVNPNPDIGAGTGFRKALAAAGISLQQFLNETIMAAP
jgi:D-alanine-D-alanine ligase